MILLCLSGQLVFPTLQTKIKKIRKNPSKYNLKQQLKYNTGTKLEFCKLCVLLRQK